LRDCRSAPAASVRSWARVRHRRLLTLSRTWGLDRLARSHHGYDARRWSQPTLPRQTTTSICTSGAATDVALRRGERRQRPWGTAICRHATDPAPSSAAAAMLTDVFQLYRHPNNLVAVPILEVDLFRSNDLYVRYVTAAKANKTMDRSCGVCVMAARLVLHVGPPPDSSLPGSTSLERPSVRAGDASAPKFRGSEAGILSAPVRGSQCHPTNVEIESAHHHAESGQTNVKLSRTR
jgi:hypothetical protein